jgi:hypothetical protein
VEEMLEVEEMFEVHHSVYEESVYAEMHHSVY